MPLFAGLIVLTFAIALGGILAGRQHQERGTIPLIKSFAIAAAGSVAVLHLIPEAIEEAGVKSLIVIALGFALPGIIERATPEHHHEEKAPTTVLAMGYAAVIVHQFGEGAAIASLARANALSIPIVFAVAAHTVPLAMVVAIRIFEHQNKRNHSALWVALIGIAVATLAGSAVGQFSAASNFAKYKPWILAAVAGLLLHAVWHDATSHEHEKSSRYGQLFTGLLGLAITAIGVDISESLGRSQWIGVIVLTVLLFGKGFIAPKWFVHSHRHK